MRHTLVLGSAALLMLCSDAASSASTVGQTVPKAQLAAAQQLRKIALELATANHGSVAMAYAVASKRADAVAVESGDIVDDNEDVWLIQVVGKSPFRCDACSRPSNEVGEPSSRYITLIVNRQTYQPLDFGYDPTMTDLKSLGPVLQLIPQ